MGLWEQLVAAPGDLSATRVWADALTEKGDPQGEAISLACALEELPPGDARAPELQEKVDRLEARHGRVWLDRLWPGVASRELTPRLFRGLPFGLTGQLPQILSTRQLALRPVASLGAVWARGEDLTALAALPELKKLVDLSLQQFWGELDLTGLLASPHLGPLVRLALSGRREGWAGPKVVGLLKRLTGLRTLSLSGFALTDADLAALAQLPSLTSLEIDGGALTPAGLTSLMDGACTLHTLALRQAGVKLEHVQALLKHPKAASLRVLDLSGATLGKKAGAVLGEARVHTLRLGALEGPKPDWEAFLDGSGAGALRELSLAQVALRVDGAKLLARTKALARLESLDVSGCYLGDEGVAELAKAKHLGALRWLSLAGNTIKGPGLPALAKGPLLGPVETLSLAHNKFGSEGGKALGASKQLGSLKTLVLGHNWLGVLGMRALLANPTLTKLERIRSGENNFGPEVLTSYVKAKKPLALTHIRAPEAKKADLLKLAAMPAAANLLTLDLSSHDFDDQVAAAFIASSSLKDVGSLSVNGRNLSPASRAALGQRFGPRVTIFD